MPGTGWVFDAFHDLRAVRLLIHSFPHLRAEVPQEVLAGIDITHVVRPPDVVSAWAGDRSAAVLLPNVPDELRNTLYPYQVQDSAFAAARIRDTGGDYLGWDRGLGKTLGALVVAKELRADTIVVVTPNSSKHAVWEPEIKKWDSNNQWKDRVYCLGGSKVKRDRTLTEWKESGGVLITHYEALRLVSGWGNVDLVIVDEAHRLARGGPGKGAPLFYRALKQIKPRYRLALSGSIIINSPEDLFGAAHWLFPDLYKSKWSDWNDRFFEYIEGAFGRELVGVLPTAVEALQTELAAWLQVRRKEDELPGLPARVDQTLYVELTAAQRKVYDDLAESFIAELPDGSVLTAPNVLSQLTKLRQVATGLDLLGEEFTDSSKLDLAIELIQSTLPRKTVVFAWHRATCTALHERLTALGIDSEIVTGDVKQHVRGEHVKRFQEDDTCKVIVATIKTLGESVTLHAASDLIFVESSWTPADMEQAADRVYRIGQVSHVTVTNILAKDTVDEFKVLPRLQTKEQLRKAVLGGMNGN